jgi:hypothetical protein
MSSLSMAVKVIFSWWGENRTGRGWNRQLGQPPRASISEQTVASTTPTLQRRAHRVSMVPTSQPQLTVRDTRRRVSPGVEGLGFESGRPLS